MTIICKIKGKHNNVHFFNLREKTIEKSVFFFFCRKVFFPYIAVNKEEIEANNCQLLRLLHVYRFLASTFIVKYYRLLQVTKT